MAEWPPGRQQRLASLERNAWDVATMKTRQKTPEPGDGLWPQRALCISLPGAPQVHLQGSGGPWLGRGFCKMAASEAGPTGSASKAGPLSCPAVRPGRWAFPCPQQPGISHRLAVGGAFPWQWAVPSKVTAVGQVPTMGMGVSPRATDLDRGPRNATHRTSS